MRRAGQDYHFFCLETIPLCKRHYPDPGLLALLLRVAETSTALRACCTALASLHHCHEAKAGKLGSTLLQSLKNVNKAYGFALTELQRGVRNGSASLTELALACIVMATFESLRDKSQEMLVHLRIGLRICQDANSGTIDESILWTLSRQGYLHALHGRPRVCSAPEVCTLDPPLIMHSRPTFETLEDASNRLSDLSRSVLQYILMIDRHAFASELDRCCGQAKLQVDFSSWQRGMELLGHDTIAPSHPPHASSCHLLARFWSQWTFLAVYAGDRQWCAYDDYSNLFKRIVSFMDHSLVATNDDAPAIFALASGSIAVLFNVVLACRVLEIRKHALCLLRKCPQHEGAWNSELMFKVGTLVINFEEGHRESGQIPEEGRVQQLQFDKIEGDDVVVLITRSSESTTRTVVPFAEL